MGVAPRAALPAAGGRRQPGVLRVQHGLGARGGPPAARGRAVRGGGPGGPRHAVVRCQRRGAARRRERVPARAPGAVRGPPRGPRGGAPGRRRPRPRPHPAARGRPGPGRGAAGAHGGPRGARRAHGRERRQVRRGLREGEAPRPPGRGVAEAGGHPTPGPRRRPSPSRPAARPLSVPGRRTPPLPLLCPPPSPPPPPSPVPRRWPRTPGWAWWTSAPPSWGTPGGGTS